MSAETITTADYNNPAAAETKLAILADRHGYTESQTVSLHGKPMTLAVINGGVLQVAEGIIKRSSGRWAMFIHKGERNVSEVIPFSDIVGHIGGYNHTAALAAGALSLFNAITVDEVRVYLAARELETREEESRQTMVAIERICRDVQTLQADRQAADARILASLDTPALALAA